MNGPRVECASLVLYFHHVGETHRGHYTSITRQEFRRTLELIRGKFVLGSWPPGREALSASRSLESPVVLLSFDDGYAETIESVVPILGDAGINAAFFVITDHIGRTMRNASFNRAERHASWALLRDVASAGHVIGSHSATHRPLSQLPRPEQTSEIARSVAVLSDELGTQVDTFAYPYGDVPPAAHALPLPRFAFGTVKSSVCQWSCRPWEIGRRYVPARSGDGAAAMMGEWLDEWQDTFVPTGQCGDTHPGAQHRVAVNVAEPLSGRARSRA